MQNLYITIYGLYCKAFRAIVLNCMIERPLSHTVIQIIRIHIQLLHRSTMNQDQPQHGEQIFDPN